MFGLPGGCILPAYDPLLESSIRHVLVRHEQGAGHMAEGYAHVTGRPGVAMVTSGPAATNLVTPLMDAFMDSIPMVGITGQVSTPAIGTDAFQECDTLGITRSCTKHNELVMTPEEIPMAIRQAFHIASTGRPGPTLVDLPKDVLQNEMTWYWPSDDEVAASLPGYRPDHQGPPEDDPGGRQADHGVRAAGAVRRRRHAQGACGRGAARARRADRHPRRHDADGARRVPRRPPAGARHARHARHGHGDHVDAEGRPADRARRPLRRPHHRQDLDLRARTPRSSTSTSIPPSRARSGVPTFRSSATAGSSPRS